MSGFAKFVSSTTVVVMVMACSEQEIGPTASRLLPTSVSRSVSSFDVSPASLDWQQRARDLVGANRLSPLAAARLYAALSVAEYRAVSAIDDEDQDGTIPAEGLGAGGRSALEAHRGAVAGASAQVLAFFFPSSSAASEQLVQDEANTGPGNVHPE